MRFSENMKLAIGGLRGNPLRSFLTVLGVVIGVTAVIVMVSIGEGTKSNVTSRIQGLGSDLLVVSPGRGGNRAGGFGAFGAAQNINNDIVDYLQEYCTLCGDIAPEASANQAVRGPLASVMTRVVGVTPEYQFVRSYNVASGTFIGQSDIESRRQVALLGSSVAEETFGEQDPVGQVVRIGAKRFTVIGVLEAKGQSGFTNIDDQVLVPLTTGQRRVWGNERLSSIYLKIGNEKIMKQAQTEVEDLLYARLEDENAYVVSNQAEILSTMESITNTFTWTLAGIAGVSLLVGGIGIMNIMLVSVTERIREIGLRKALGAKRLEILLQFLFEAITLSILGGIIGILIGGVGSRLINHYAGWNTVVSLSSVLLSFGFSFAVGLFFGVYPASKPYPQHPVEALRHE